MGRNGNERRGVHSCDVWTRRGINCPGGLLDTREGLSTEPGDEQELVDQGQRSVPIVPPARRHQKAGNVSEALANFQLAVLMELGRQALVEEAIGRIPREVRIPAEMVKEAFRQGARGKELALWVAAAAATLAVAVRFGPGVASMIPRLIGPSSSGTAGIGFRFQAPVFTKDSIKKRVSDFVGRSGSGNFFPGILG